MLAVLPCSIKHLDVNLVYSNMRPFVVPVDLLTRLRSLTIASVCTWWVESTKTPHATIPLQSLNICGSTAAQPQLYNTKNLRVLEVHAAHAKEGTLARMLPSVKTLRIVGCIKGKHMATLRMLGECQQLRAFSLQSTTRLHEVLALLPAGLTYLSLGEERLVGWDSRNLQNLRELHCAGVESVPQQLRVLGCAMSQWPAQLRSSRHLETLYTRSDWCVAIRPGVVLWVCCRGAELDPPTQPPWCLWSTSCCVFSAAVFQREIIQALGCAPTEVDDALATVAWVARRAHRCIGAGYVSCVHTGGDFKKPPLQGPVCARQSVRLDAPRGVGGAAAGVA